MKFKILINGKKFKPLDYKIGYLPEERGLYPKRKVAEQIIYLATLFVATMNQV